MIREQRRVAGGARRAGDAEPEKQPQKNRRQMIREQRRVAGGARRAGDAEPEKQLQNPRLAAESDSRAALCR